MTTTLSSALTLLSKDLGDYFASTTTAAGTVGGTTLVDNALKAEEADWIFNRCWARITEGAYANDERKITSLAPTTGTLTCLAFDGQIDSGTDYEIHRLFSPADKRQALIDSAKLAYPYLYTAVRDESQVAGNWLRNGDLETWTSTDYPDYWRVSDVTAAASTTAKTFLRGDRSCKLDTAAGYLYQNWTLHDDLKYLRGQTVTFSGRGWCDTASALRLAIYDGSTTTYSGYHEGNSAWDDEHQNWEVTALIPEDATDVEFRVYLDNAAATAYVDDLRVIGPRYPKIYIGHLNLAQNQARKVSFYPDAKGLDEPVNCPEFKMEDGWLYLGIDLRNYRLRIEGTGYLSFLKSGAESDAWDAEINLDDPQTRLLSAEAALILYQQMTGRYAAGDNEYALERLAYWVGQRAERRLKFAMPSLPVQIKRNA